MEAQEFCYWLQGWFELNKTINHREGASPSTMKMIEEHLQLVFNKVTPELGTPLRNPGNVEWDSPTPYFPYSHLLPGLEQSTIIC